MRQAQRHPNFVRKSKIRRKSPKGDPLKAFKGKEKANILIETEKRN